MFHILNCADLEMKSGPKEKWRTQERGENCIATLPQCNQIQSRNFIYPDSALRVKSLEKNTQVTEKEEKGRNVRKQVEMISRKLVLLPTPRALLRRSSHGQCSVTSRRFSKCTGVVGMSTWYPVGILGY